MIRVLILFQNLIMYKYNVRLKYASTCMYKFYYDSDTINVFVQLTLVFVCPMCKD